MGAQCGYWRPVWGFVHFISEFLLVTVKFDTNNIARYRVVPLWTIQFRFSMGNGLILCKLPRPFFSKFKLTFRRP